MHIEEGRDGAPAARADAPHVIAHRAGNIKTAPSEQLGSPGYIRVFTVDEEVGVEELVPYGNVGDHLAAVESGRGAGSEHVFHLAETAVVGLMPAAVEMTHGGREVDAGRIDQPFGQRLQIPVAGQQAAAYRSQSVVDACACDQSRDEARQQPRIRIQDQHPVAVTGGDGLVLRRREPDVAIVVDDPDPAAESRQDLAGAVGGRVIHHHYVERAMGLPENGSQTGLEVSPAIMGDDGDGYRGGH